MRVDEEGQKDDYNESLYQSNAAAIDECIKHCVKDLYLLRELKASIFANVVESLGIICKILS